MLSQRSLLLFWHVSEELWEKVSALILPHACGFDDHNRSGLSHALMFTPSVSSSGQLTLVLHFRSIPWSVSDFLPADFVSLLNALADPQAFYTTFRCQKARRYLAKVWWSFGTFGRHAQKPALSVLHPLLSFRDCQRILSYDISITNREVNRRISFFRWIFTCIRRSAI